jgi:hypothetical protein
MRWARYVRTIMREMKEAYRTLIGKSEGKRPVVRPKHISKKVKYVCMCMYIYIYIYIYIYTYI